MEKTEVIGRFRVDVSDNTEYLTTRWQQLVLERMNKKAEEFGDDIILGLIDDGRGGDPFFPITRFPVYSLSHIEAFGYVYPLGKGPEFMYRVYEKLNRLVSLTHVRFRSLDEQTKELFADDQVDLEAAKLADYIHSKHPNTPCSRRCPK